MALNCFGHYDSVYDDGCQGYIGVSGTYSSTDDITVLVQSVCASGGAIYSSGLETLTFTNPTYNVVEQALVWQYNDGGEVSQLARYGDTWQCAIHKDHILDYTGTCGASTNKYPQSDGDYIEQGTQDPSGTATPAGSFSFLLGYIDTSCLPEGITGSGFVFLRTLPTDDVTPEEPGECVKCTDEPVFSGGGGVLQ